MCRYKLSFFITITPVLHLAGFGDVVPEFLHVPGGGRAAFGAEAAVQADVFVFDHDAGGFQRRRRRRGPA